MLNSNYVYCLILFTLFTAIICRGQDNDAVSWGSRKISWADFKGAPVPKNPAKAGIACMIDYKIEYLKKDSIAAEVINFFYPSKSWTTVRTDDVLDHELKHFDIAEIYTRMFRKTISETVFNRKGVEKEIGAILNKMEKEMSKFEELYDKETNHVLNLEQQKNWNNKIAEELQSLDQFKAKLVPLHIKKK
jgi:hypothetical protein